MKKLITILMLSTAGHLASCQSNDNKSATSVAGQIQQTIPASEFEQKIASLQGAQLIDVRTPEEYADGHLKDAANVDFNGDNFEADLAKLDKSKPVLVYCKSGGRSGRAAGKMKDMGFKVIYNLDGGIGEWIGANKPVVTGK